MRETARDLGVSPSHLEQLPEQPNNSREPPTIEQMEVELITPEDPLSATWRRKLEERQQKRRHMGDDLASVRRLVGHWVKLIVAVEEALRLGVTDPAAMIHISRVTPNLDNTLTRCP